MIIPKQKKKGLIISSIYNLYSFFHVTYSALYDIKSIKVILDHFIRLSKNNSTLYFF